MKQKLISTTRTWFIGLLVVFSLSNCTKSDKAEVLQANAAPTRKNDKSLNLTKQFRVDFESLNHSGAHGTAMLWLDGNMLTVQIDAAGLEAGKLHPQHIHGFMDNSRNATCPTSSADTDGDGIISLAEGLPSYGPVLLPLTDFPTADATGEVHYTQKFSVDASLMPLQNRAIVLHGMTMDGQYVATLPVACGQVMTWNGE